LQLSPDYSLPKFVPLTNITIQYNTATNDQAQCTIEIADAQVEELLHHFQPLFAAELRRASFSKKQEQTVISFWASKAKIQRLEQVIQEAKAMVARLN